MGIFGWSLPPGAAGDPYAPYNEEEEMDNSTLEQAFGDYEGLGQIYRAYYKYTDCGPSMGANVSQWVQEDGEEPVYEQGPDGEYSQVGTSRFSGSKQELRWYYCEDLYKLGTWEDMRKKGQRVVALVFSSIVEGVDYGTGPQQVVIDPQGDPEELRKACDAAVDEVDAEANGIWADTHGCETCAKLWHAEGVFTHESGEFEGADGVTPVHMGCPDCGGDGICI
jgi:hypothetical protein